LNRKKVSVNKTFQFHFSVNASLIQLHYLSNIKNGFPCFKNERPPFDIDTIHIGHDNLKFLELCKKWRYRNSGPHAYAIRMIVIVYDDSKHALP